MSDAAKYNVEKLIEIGNKMVISRDTIAADYETLLNLRDFYMFLKERKDAEDKPDKDRIKARKEGYDTYMKRIEAILEKAEPDFVALNTDIKLQEKVIIGQIEKNNAIRNRHKEFVNEMVKSVMVAEDNKELGRIQSLVGSEKARKTFYGDYFLVIEDVCNSLLQLVDERKLFIKSNQKLSAEMKKWTDAGDIPKATQIKEQMDQSERVLHQNALAIAQDAYKKVSDVQMQDTDIVSAAITPRLHRWSWKVDDIELMYKKTPNLVVKEPNTKAINAFLKEKVEADELDDLEDNVFNGLILYRKQFYVSIKSKDDAS